MQLVSGPNGAGAGVATRQKSMMHPLLQLPLRGERWLHAPMMAVDVSRSQRVRRTLQASEGTHNGHTAKRGPRSSSMGGDGPRQKRAQSSARIAALQPTRTRTRCLLSSWLPWLPYRHQAWAWGLAPVSSEDRGARAHQSHRRRQGVRSLSSKPAPTLCSPRFDGSR